MVPLTDRSARKEGSGHSNKAEKPGQEQIQQETAAQKEAGVIEFERSQPHKKTVQDLKNTTQEAQKHEPESMQERQEFRGILMGIRDDAHMLSGRN